MPFYEEKKPHVLRQVLKIGQSPSFNPLRAARLTYKMYDGLFLRLIDDNADHFVRAALWAHRFHFRERRAFLRF